MNLTISILLITVGLINFLPVIGIISAEKLSAAYAVELIGNDIVILMRHRALLFGLIGGFMLYSVWKPSYQSVAMVMAAISMLGFLFFVAAADHYNASITKIAIIDLIGLAGLAIAAGLKYLSRNSLF
ncbi:hypothetical protein GB2207_04377 [gamma proteobacterium HTCC2207]|jgi:hypothetical protein|uniref:Phosphopantetheine adenylyltransferase n=1 Tax=gamma proteobacterium HTCC2207 TaxID=314287 RepID=Q1YS61_9GAMM|nr:hypothetical protein GB2207_04377 [gamma proteobacterium HTCC2207]MBT6592608.1 hypothetical protein [Porticoccaceae bacterium]